MAILESLLGVEVSIWSGGSQLPEYEDIGDNVRLTWKHKTVSKYVECELDTEFFFKYKVSPPYVHDCDWLGFAVIWDGSEDEGQTYLCGPHHLDDAGKWEYEIRGVETLDEEGAKIHKFKFSKILTTDEQAGNWSEKEKAKMENIGQIEVRVLQLQNYRMEKSKPKQKTKPKSKPKQKPKQKPTPKPKPNHLRYNQDVVYEKLLAGRAISHRISIESEEKISEPSGCVDARWMHGWDGPIGVFRFKYRTRVDLQRELIIPRTPSPEPPGLPTIAELTTEEKVRLARMRFDDIEMLKSLTTARTRSTAPGRGSPQSSFDDLTPEEVDLLAMEKHSEMTGVPNIKREARKVKTELFTTRASMLPHILPLKEHRRPDGKTVVDLISSSSESGIETDEDADPVAIGRQRERKRMGSKAHPNRGPINANLRYSKSRYASFYSNTHKTFHPTIPSTPTSTAPSDPPNVSTPAPSSIVMSKSTSKSKSRCASRREPDEEIESVEEDPGGREEVEGEEEEEDGEEEEEEDDEEEGDDEEDEDEEDDEVTGVDTGEDSEKDTDADDEEYNNEEHPIPNTRITRSKAAALAKAEATRVDKEAVAKKTTPPAKKKRRLQRRGGNGANSDA